MRASEGRTGIIGAWHPPSPIRDPDTVIVGMSGGVDSAVAALLLQGAGHAVQGLFMSNWEDDDDGYCTTAADFQDARRVCETLGIPLHRVSFAGEYRERVFRHFLREYAAGRTPNPDVLCNREIKFGVCLDYMHRLGAGRIATGHYARLRRTEHGTELLKAADDVQGSELFSAQRRAGGSRQDPVSRSASCARTRCAGAPTRPAFRCTTSPTAPASASSASGRSRTFSGRYLEGSAGPIEDPAGKVIGEHRGLALYTLGQRSGLRVGGRAGQRAGALVCRRQGPRAQCAHRGAGSGPPAAHVGRLRGGGTPLAGRRRAATSGPRTRHAFECTVKTRYRQSDLACSVELRTAGRARVALRRPARAVTPGQYAVSTAAICCLGGGIIAESRRLPR